MILSLAFITFGFRIIDHRIHHEVIANKRTVSLYTFSILALMATTMVLALIKTAPTAGLSITPA
jgi:hypothetical protein